MSDFDDVERRLRDSLRAHAGDAPPGDPVADRVLGLVSAPSNVVPLHRRWVTWSAPLVAAAAVAAVVLAILNTGGTRNTSAPADTSTVPPVNPTSVQTTTVVPPVSPPPTPVSTPTGTHTGPSHIPIPPPVRDTGHTTPSGPERLTGFRAVDATFIGTDEGWAIGTSDCLGGSGRCPAMLRSTDGGQSWQSMPQPGGAQIGANGIAHIRFATPEVGYAFGPHLLYLTTNGGTTWSKQPGGAIALEAWGGPSGNVIRLTEACGDGSCSFGVETAPVASSDWTSVRMPAAGTVIDTPGDVQLVRSSDQALILVRTPGQIVLWTDQGSDGASWGSIPQPCGTDAGAGVRNVPLSVAGDGRIAVLCRDVAARGPSHDGYRYVVVSSDGGQSFGPRGQFVSGADTVAGDPATVLIAAGDGAYRSTNKGLSWQPIPGLRNQRVSFVGFESASVGKIITEGGAVIWLTTDAGRTWTPASFSG